jgi:hypothetical protein
MARSSYVYVVTDGPVGPPVAAFTVKHELLTWVERSYEKAQFHTYWRLSDNPVDPALAERLGMTPNLPREIALGDLLSGRQIR